MSHPVSTLQKLILISDDDDNIPNSICFGNSWPHRNMFQDVFIYRSETWEEKRSLLAAIKRVSEELVMQTQKKNEPPQSVQSAGLLFSLCFFYC